MAPEQRPTFTRAALERAAREQRWLRTIPGAGRVHIRSLTSCPYVPACSVGRSVGQHSKQNDRPTMHKLPMSVTRDTDCVLLLSFYPFEAADEVVAYSGQGIGDCAGGPFRMLFGDGPQAQIAATLLKVWLILIPLTSSLQWMQRAFNAARLLGKRWKTTRPVWGQQHQSLCLRGVGKVWGGECQRSGWIWSQIRTCLMRCPPRTAPFLFPFPSLPSLPPSPPSTACNGWSLMPSTVPGSLETAGRPL